MRKNSKQRELILNILKESYSHPTANEVFTLARKVENNISLGTVYRNLEILCEDNIIEKIPTPLGVDRYDFKKSEHSHAICEKCGRVFDFVSHANLNKIKKEVYSQTTINTKINEIRIIGICKECNKQ